MTRSSLFYKMFSGYINAFYLSSPGCRGCQNIIFRQELIHTKKQKYMYVGTSHCALLTHNSDMIYHSRVLQYLHQIAFLNQGLLLILQCFDAIISRFTLSFKLQHLGLIFLQCKFQSKFEDL